ncbi:MAG: hypothetical protein HQL15_04150 [Candidatus Omnitrophica bacterium]|nr:hypothetical protein [Candidatus Omnitrophota bacterium]
MWDQKHRTVIKLDLRWIKPLLLILFIFLYSLIPTSAFAIDERFTDSSADGLHSRQGTIVFKVKMLKDMSMDRHTHSLILSTSSDGSEMYDIFIIQNTIVARRYFSGCLLSAFSKNYDFKLGEWHGVKITWNGASTKFYIDNQEVPRYSLSMSHDLAKTIPEIRFAKSDAYDTGDLLVLGSSEITVDSADRTFELNATCPRLDELLKESPQEDYKGIRLLHFPDQVIRDKIKSFIDLLPEDFAGSIKGVLYVEDSRAPKTGEGGEANADTMTIILKGSYAGDPTVFFHEAAHIYDMKKHFAIGVSDDKSEWTAISGPTCYLKAANVDEFSKEFAEKHVQAGFLAPQGGECPFEDLAIWTGAAYDYYLKNQSMIDMLTPGNPKYSVKNKQKLDFLLQKGFISQNIYNKVSSR